MELKLNFEGDAERLIETMASAGGKTAEEIIVEGIQLRRAVYEEATRNPRTIMKFVRPNGSAVIYPIDTYGSDL